MIALAIVAAGLLVAAAVVVSQTEPVIRSRYRKAVIVTCKNDRAWRGVLYQADRSTIVLRNAEMIGGSTPVVVDGEVLLQRADIEFMQRL